MTRHSNGFSLIEVMAALVLVAIVLPIAMRGFSMSSNIASLAKQRSEAATLAESKLSELSVTRDYQHGLLSGDFAPDHPEFQWTAELDNWDSSTLQQLTIHVKWTARGNAEELRASTLVDTTQ